MNALSSLIYNLMIYSSRFCNCKIFSRIWNKTWGFLCKYIAYDVITRIHGKCVKVNFGYPYPLIARQYPLFNNPLIDLVYQLYNEKKRKISIIDAGAGIGDTVLMLEANCPGMVNEFYCIEGDKEFFCYLQNNLNNLTNMKLFHSLLSSTCEDEKTLVRTHKGTASVQGNSKITAITLDSLILPNKNCTFDLIKIDVDGFDGRVLLGSKEILRKDCPAVIFEWHPTLCTQTGNNWTDHFNVLVDTGYQKFIWFNKFGEFSHFMECLDIDGINTLAEFCLNSRVYTDWHYDVIALNNESTISPIALAESNYARNRKSRY